MTATPGALPADLQAGLTRLRLANLRRIAAEILQTATTQRCKSDEILRTLLKAEIAARDEGNLRGRHLQAGVPVETTFDGFDVAASSVPQPTVDDLAGLEWVRMPEDLCLVGPAGTGTSHLRIAAGHAAVEAGHRVGSLTAAELVETLSRSIARSQRRPGHRLPAAQRRRPRRRGRLRSARGHRHPAALAFLQPPPTNAAPPRSPPTGRATTPAGTFPSTPPPPPGPTGSCTTPWSSTPTATATGCAPQETAPRPNPTQPRGEYHPASNGQPHMAMDAPHTGLHLGLLQRGTLSAFVTSKQQPRAPFGCHVGNAVQA